MEKFKLMMRFSLILAGAVILAEAQAQNYKIVDRFQLLEDKFRTQEMLRPLEHDFIFDITALANVDALDFVDGASDVAKFEGTDEQKLAEAQRFLREYNKTEQNLRISGKLGVPLPSFTAWGINFKPSLRADVNLGFLMGIQSSNLTLEQILDYVPSEYDDVKNLFRNCVNLFPPYASPGSPGTYTKEQRDIADFMRDASNQAACGITALPAAQRTVVLAALEEIDNKDTAIYPDDTSIPDILNYLKGEGRVGLNLDYVYNEHFFGTFSLYALGRADYRVRISADSLTSNETDVAELPDELNTTINSAIDYRFGYKNGNLIGYLAVEDLKISRLSDKEEEGGGQLLYGEDMLLRLHGEYLYKLEHFSLRAFGGFHKRSSYGFGEGLYAGADVMGHLWQDRLGLRVRGMLDSEHFTFSPLIKLWLVHVEYMLKQPIKSDVDGVKPSTIHSVNFRIAI